MTEVEPHADHPDAPFSRAAVSFADDWRTAIDEVIASVAATSAPDLVLLFASSRFLDAFEPLLDRVHDTLAPKRLVGSSARGVLAGSDARENTEGVSILAIWAPGLQTRALRLLGESEFWEGALPPVDPFGMMLFVEPFRCDAQAALVRVRNAWKGVPIVGAQASSHVSDRQAWVFLDDEVISEGGVALALEGDYALDTVIAQGGTPIGDPWTVTGAECSRITTISNRPALEVLQETIEDLPDHMCSSHPVLVGFPMSEYQDQFHCGDFVMRGIIERNEDEGWLRVGSIVRVGQTIQFHLREPDDASIRWDDALRTYADEQPGGFAAVLCTCTSRGSRMFDVEDYDATVVADVFPAMPIAGIYSFGEIGPVCGIPAINGFAASIGILRPR